jgi:hypothetical protein
MTWLMAACRIHFLKDQQDGTTMDVKKLLF